MPSPLLRFRTGSSVRYNADMVTQQDLVNHIGRAPFVPFRVTLHSGEVIDVTRRFGAVAMPGRLVIATEEDRLRWIQLDRIARVEAFQIPNSSTN